MQYSSSCANLTINEGQNRLFARQISEPVVFRGNTASADEKQNGGDLKQRVCKKAKRRSGNSRTDSKVNISPLSLGSSCFWKAKCLVISRQVKATWVKFCNVILVNNGFTSS